MELLEYHAKALKELGHPARLAVYKRLSKAGYQGLPVGSLQKELGIPGSTLSHHLSALMAAGLVKQQRDGRTLFCIAQYDRFDALVAYLQDQCCADEQ
ncbi:ArsR/SmtB family transcription factor [Ferrimonas marina]|uniref:DNA-binding transcriptional regulator, ArsR family n=1 Tax=Ferrimonas marina TaxID=299255 RepID=A0A1M5YBN6_9GAMM|nr:metalloregulator ArsR/SmtB family transcription factor [Ferrimonas marina]SHI09392.1 DNA-binding transcriptional regulator, ArsR family [Ferrimonas marina]